MYVIKVKNKDLYLFRKPYKLVTIDNADTYRNENSAKIALKSSQSPFPLDVLQKLGLASFSDFEIREVKLELI